MELYFWKATALCRELQLRFPKNSHPVEVKTPLFAREIIVNGKCLCQHIDCPVIRDGLCTRTAIFTSTESTDRMAKITPYLQNILQSLPTTQLSAE